MDDEPSAIGVGPPRGTEMAKDVVSEVIIQGTSSFLHLTYAPLCPRK